MRPTSNLGLALDLRQGLRQFARTPAFGAAVVLLLALDASGPRYDDPEKVAAFFDEAVTQVGALPGVTATAAINRLPLEGGSNSTATIDGRDAGLGPGPDVENRVITRDYFNAMGIRVVSGRAFDATDSNPNSLRVAVINQAMARVFWPGGPALGGRFRFEEGPWLTVVGIVADTRQWGIERPPRPEAYELATSTVEGIRPKLLMVRAASDPLALVGEIRRRIAAIDQGVSVADVRTMTDVVDQATADRRFGALLIGLFALTALLLVSAAIYALMSSVVARRTPEFGVRMAFGATPGAVLRLVMRSALAVTGAGAAAGFVGVVLSARAMRAVVYGFSPDDPLMMVLGAVGLVAIGLAGAVVPAFRATRVDPITALRAE